MVFFLLERTNGKILGTPMESFVWGCARRVAHERVGKAFCSCSLSQSYDSNEKDGSNLNHSVKNHSLYLPVSFRMFGVQVYRISISCHAIALRWLRMKVFFFFTHHMNLLWLQLNPFKFLVCKYVSTFLLNLVKTWLDRKSELICLGQLPTGLNIFFVQSSFSDY